MEKRSYLAGHMTAAEYAASPFDTVILPLGSFESHGPHLPFATDALTAYLIACNVAEKRIGTSVLPPLNYGMSEYYKQFSFTISLHPETESAVIRDILVSVGREGIRKVFIMNGHDGNIPSIEIAAHQARVNCPEMKIVGINAWWNMLGFLLPPDFFEVYNGLGHGGEGELSISLALFPELCRPELAQGVVPDLPANLDVMWLFSELTDCGASGDPTKATREKGIAMRDTLVAAIVKILDDLDVCGWDYRSPGLGKR
jgi:creatinine amidohydrolase